MNYENVVSGTLLKGKRGLIMGVANSRSIAWGIASALHAQGAELAYTYQGEVLKKRILPLAETTKSKLILECDVTKDDNIDQLFYKLSEEWDNIDFVVHSIAFSQKEELMGKYVDLSLENFLTTMQISCYSFTAVAKRAEKIMNNGGSLLTMTYYGAEKVMPHYNVMGVAKAALEGSVKYLAVDLGNSKIRVNAISAGPIKTLAASGIGDFRYILKWNEYNAPLKRTVTIQEVGNSATYLVSNLSSGVTGQVLYVDAGYHVVGMKAVDAPDISTV
ncbi:MAG: enoyl-ACP reductase FabI [Rickettsiales bacterium]|nr:enoyl-ACP reductase FabI [Rickettsiales bacterium]